MFVYVISAGTDRQKVGKGRDPEERRRLLQTGTSDPLEVVHAQCVTGALGVEGRAHKLLEAHRLRGEWFATSPAVAIQAVRDAVAELGAARPEPPREPRVPRKIVDGEGLEARRASVRKYHAKREADGLKKVTLWLSPEARAKLDALKAGAGSKDKAAELAIMAYGQKQRTAPAKTAPFEVRFEAPPTQSELSRAPKVSIQVGPPERKPGSLQKKGK